MKVTVDYEMCASTGGCMQICPEVFEVRSDGFLYVLQEEPAEPLWEQVRTAADLCPTAAIELIEDRPRAVGFLSQLERSWESSDSLLCVGLDPDPAQFPAPLDGARDAVYRFCVEIVDATADLACAFKPQVAYFSSQREEPALERLCHYIRERYPDVTLILDAKRGDIGSTAEHYAREAFGRYAAHAVTVNPYLGTDSVAPYFEHGGGVIGLCRTSNPGGDDLQGLDCEGRPLYARVAEMIATRWAALGDCGLVVGATYPDELAVVRSIVGDLPILVPGIGAQGGDPQQAVAAGARSDGRGLIISSSRAILYASSGDDFADAARHAAVEARRATR